MRTIMARREEETIQRGMVDLMHKCVPSPENGGPVWTAINPVPGKTKAIAGVSKAMGLKKSFPDVHMLWKQRAIYFEVKKPGGTVPKDQRDMHDQLTLQGGVVFITRSVEEFAEQLRTVGVPVNGRM